MVAGRAGGAGAGGGYDYDCRSVVSAAEQRMSVSVEWSVDGEERRGVLRAKMKK